MPAVNRKHAATLEVSRCVNVDLRQPRPTAHDVAATCATNRPP